MSKYKEIRFDDAEAPVAARIFTKGGPISISFADEIEPAAFIGQIVDAMRSAEPRLPGETQKKR